MHDAIVRAYLPRLMDAGDGVMVETGDEGYGWQRDWVTMEIGGVGLGREQVANIDSFYDSFL
ncbi:Zinc finger, RanBP2-type [Sesbania bispinosa]|nr:Zinc finger, RanBP2-type [Sesbania bispinosa]